MSRMSNSTGINRSSVTRPDSSKLVELHVYVVPPDIYREKFNNVLNSTLDDTISVGFIRVSLDTKLYLIREDIDQQIGTDIIPRDYVFLKSIGRSLTRVKPKQEYQLKVKNFCPPLAYVPEIYLLEVTADLRAILGVTSDTSSIHSMPINTVLGDDSPRNPTIRSRFPPLNNSYEHYPFDEYDADDTRQRSRRHQAHADRLVEDSSRRKRFKNYRYNDSWNSRHILPQIHSSEAASYTQQKGRLIDGHSTKGYSGDYEQSVHVADSRNTPTHQHLPTSDHSSDTYIDQLSDTMKQADRSLQSESYNSLRSSYPDVNHTAASNSDNELSSVSGLVSGSVDASSNTPIPTLPKPPLFVEYPSRCRKSVASPAHSSKTPPHVRTTQNPPAHPQAHVPPMLHISTHTTRFHQDTALKHLDEQQRHTSATDANTGETGDINKGDDTQLGYNEGVSIAPELNITVQSINQQEGYGNNEVAQDYSHDQVADADTDIHHNGVTNTASEAHTSLTNGDVLDRRKSESKERDVNYTGDGEDGQYESERLKGSYDDSYHGNKEGENHDGNGDINNVNEDNENGSHNDAAGDYTDAIPSSNEYVYGQSSTGQRDDINVQWQMDHTHLSGNVRPVQYNPEADADPEAMEDEDTAKRSLDHFSDEDSDRLTPVPHERRKFTEEDKRRMLQEKEELNAELNGARDERRKAEKKREDTVKRAKIMQTKTQNRRNHIRDIWKKRYFEEKKKTAPLEDQTNRNRLEIDQIHRKLMGYLESPKDGRLRSKHEEPSHLSNLKIQATKLQHVNGDLQRRIDTLKMKLTAEMKLRNQAESELRSLRSDLTQKKINLTLTRSQQLASLSTSQDNVNVSFMTQPAMASPRPQNLVG